MRQIDRRQLLAGGLGLGASLCLPSVGRAQLDEPFRIGVVTPSSSGESPVRASVERYIGDAARQGALLAEGPVSEEAAAAGIRLVLGMANAPTADAAVRAGERFVTTGVDAIIGGVGFGQADVLSRIAEDAGVPFLNVGSSDRSLRQACRHFTFHMAPSAAMYLDAMAMWGASQGYRRWYIVHEDNPAGAEMAQRAVRAVNRYADDAEAIEATSAVPGEVFYGPQLNGARAAGAEVILLLLDYIDQVVFLGQQESLRVEAAVIPFPDANGQTRSYINSFAAIDLTTSPDFRIAMWDAALTEGGADAFNTRYLARWGAAADPQAWSAYHAVKVLFEAAYAAGSFAGEALAEELENSGAAYDVLKGPGVSFRPWDHQLRQPLYVIRVNHDNDWEVTLPTTQVTAAAPEEELPPPGGGEGDPIARLDMIGDGPEDADCDV